MQIKNTIFTVSINEQNGTWCVYPADLTFPVLTGITIGATYKIRGRLYKYTTAGSAGKVSEPASIDLAEHGVLDRVTVQFPEDGKGIGMSLTLGILQEYPLVLWKTCLHNNSSSTIEVEKINVLDINPGEGGKITYPGVRKQADLGFFSSGWQSWSPTGWYRADSRMNISKAGFLQHPMIYNPGTPKPRKRGQFSSDMFAVISDNAARTGFLAGFLAQRNHFGSILADFNTGSLSMWANGDDTRLDPGQSMETDWAVFNPVLLDHRDPLDKYLEAVAREHRIRIPSETPVGWCSWYYYYSNVTAEDVQTNLSAITDMQEKLPLQLVQIDDGFETQVGDWFSFRDTFPVGVAPLAEDISREGFTPGLWLAPFIVHPKSRLFHEHPDWLLRNKSGRPSNAGLGWNSLCAGLDLTVPDALAYACRVVKTAAEEWGYPYLKLDFLYASALKGIRHDPTRTRAQVLRSGMEAIREAVGPEVMLLGCGAPLGSMLGLVELMRIGADVSGDWNPSFFGVKAFIKNEPAVPCARNSIRNILTRADLHQQWWINDPDCLLIRQDSNLTLDEVQSLAAAIALTGGSLLLSDDMSRVNPERIALAAKLFPTLEERARIIDRFDRWMPERLRLDLVNPAGEWHILARFNWTDEPVKISFSPAEYHLGEGTWHLREFWSGATGTFSGDSPYDAGIIPVYGSVVVAVRRFAAGVPAYLGGDLHISQGMELAEWLPGQLELNFTLRLPRIAEGEVAVFLPEPLLECEVNGSPVQAGKKPGGVYSIPVKMEGFAHVHVGWRTPIDQYQ